MPIPSAIKVICIMDDSGSMYTSNFGSTMVHKTRLEMDNLANNIEAKPHLNTTFGFVIFSSHAMSGKRLLSLPNISNTTNISSGWSLLT